MLAIEPQVRAFCARSLDHLVGSGGFDFIADVGAEIPMRTIGLLLGIPEEDQVALRESIDEGLPLVEGAIPEIEAQGLWAGQLVKAHARHKSERAETTSRLQLSSDARKQIRRKEE